MNNLSKESSPYLLQHANNPVHWQAWSESVLKQAKEEDKPILVSIGYSTCHWCHVMEHESFEDEAVADFMNAHFINIKVDREERPDLDHIYMEAVQLLTRSGGWPLNCFLTPEGKPFFGGTYFPPRPMHNRPSWLQILHYIHRSFTEKREQVEEQAEQLTQMIGSSNEGLRERLSVSPTSSEKPLTETLFESLRASFDSQRGGFGDAPKFPSTMALGLLLHIHQHQQLEDVLEHVRFSLRQMILGGIYDQLGGGFARYTVDAAWRIPHFEKMLYDNALIVSLLCNAYRFTQDPMLERAVQETLQFIEREMAAPEGGFYAALDADSDGEEGKFYVWQKQEVAALLEKDAQWFNTLYNVSEAGNWEGKNILYRDHSNSEYAHKLGLNEPIWTAQWQAAKDKLFQARSQRIRPGLDNKILLGWNALMITAYCQAWQVFQDEHYKATALRSLAFITEKLGTDTVTYKHTYNNGVAKQDAFLDDYAYLIQAFIDAYTLEWDPEWLVRAKGLCDKVLATFWDAEDGLFYYTSSDSNKLVVRPKEIFDNATPSGNAMMAMNLLKLAYFFNEIDYRSRAAHMLDSWKAAIQSHPTSFGLWAQALVCYEFGFNELIVIGRGAEQVANELLSWPQLNMLILCSDNPDYHIPALATHDQVHDHPHFYLCRQQHCFAPVQDIDSLKQLLSAK